MSSESLACIYNSDESGAKAVPPEGDTAIDVTVFAVDTIYEFVRPSVGEL